MISKAGWPLPRAAAAVDDPGLAGLLTAGKKTLELTAAKAEGGDGAKAAADRGAK